MRRTLTIATLVLFGISSAVCQGRFHGGGPSVTSFRGGSFHGVPSSVNSFAPRTFGGARFAGGGFHHFGGTHFVGGTRFVGAPHFHGTSVFVGGNFGFGPNRFGVFFGHGFHGHFHSGFSFGFFGAPFFGFPYYAYYPPYPYYAYPPPAYPMAYQSAPQDYDGSNDALVGEIQRLRDDVNRLRDEQYRQPVPQPPQLESKPSAAQATTVLVFRNGKREETTNYAIAGQTLWIFSETRARKVPLADLDLEATRAVNEERGVEFNGARR